MRAVDLLHAIRDREPVEPDDLKRFITDVATGAVPDYQAAAFLMAVFLRGLPDTSTVAMTLAMRDSGVVIQHPRIPDGFSGVKVDKHSTGGVGDKISIALAPLVAACGVPVPMISGRGLGHTGGTLDKVEAIPGFRVDLGIQRFREIVSTIGVCLIGQTDDLAPADRKLYALRDVTATVESVELITGSILSKKLAEGIDALVLDVKVGSGAFMKNEAAARRLAESLVRVGTGAGLKMRALLTRMEEPLGTTIGNALETREAIEILAGRGPPDTTALTLALGVKMLQLAGVAAGHEREALEKAIEEGAGADKLRALIQAQGGDPRVVEDTSLLPAAPRRTEIKAPTDGIVQSVDAYALGVAAMRLGAGRAKVEDDIDPGVGLEVLKKVGDTVAAFDTLAVAHHRNDVSEVLPQIREAFAIGPGPAIAGPLVIDRIG